MNVPFTFEIAYRISCSLCGVQQSVLEHYKLYARSEFPYPSIPNEWCVLDGNLICPNHKIEIKSANADPANTPSSRSDAIEKWISGAAVEGMVGTR